MTKVTIVGGGKIGGAIAKIIGSAVDTLSVWDIDPKKTRGERDLASAVADADVAFLCVPSWAHPDVAERLRSLLERKTQVVSLAKGMVSAGKDAFLVSEFLKQNLPAGQSFSVMSGPMIAEDLILGKPCAAVLAAESKFAIAKIAPLFNKSSLRLEYSGDLVGVCLAGVLKNIYALAVGAIEGAGFSEPRVKVALAICLDEMLRVGVRLGAKAETMKGTAGREDFLATATSKFSQNRALGFVIGRDGLTERRSEGLVSIEPVIARLGAADEFPILFALRSVADGTATARQAFKGIIK